MSENDFKKYISSNEIIMERLKKRALFRMDYILKAEELHKQQMENIAKEDEDLI